MFHANTQKLIDYWRERAGDAALPTRMAVDPTHFRELMSQVFIIGRVATGIYPIRLAGGLIADLHQKDLRQQNLITLFRDQDRQLLKAALESARRRPEPLVVTTFALTDGPHGGPGPHLPLEILFAPLAAAPGSPERFLGLYQPLALATRLQARPITTLAAQSYAGPSALAPPRLRLAAVDGRRIA